MKTTKTDLTFFTNDQNQTLLDRFKTTLTDTRLFDVLVGYFRSSGFYQLYDSIESIEKTRILVGLGIDDESHRAIDAFRSQTVLDFESHNTAKGAFQDNLVNEIECFEESDHKLEVGLKKFIEFLQTDCPDSAHDYERGGSGKKLEIRAFPSRNIHAKVYIGRFAPDDRDYGFVITGSSNFSYSGLVANREFNVELRQRRDVEYALNEFEELWRQSVDISADFIDAIQKKTVFDPNQKENSDELRILITTDVLSEGINLHRANVLINYDLPWNPTRVLQRAGRVNRLAKKLLGQIVFLYFLQKKGWLGVAKNGRWGEGDKRFMRERYDQMIKAGGKYYHDFLQYLFYEALADERKKQKDPGYYARFDCRVPFLNGGLFEADYDWRNETINLPMPFFITTKRQRMAMWGPAF